MKTDKKQEEHNEETTHDSHNEKEAGKQVKTMSFEKMEIVKGSSDMGYTAITSVNPIAPDAEIVVKAAFFVNAKLSNSGEHEH